MNGRTLAEAVRMLMPPAAEGHQSSMFLRYHSACAEPWDGPAAIAFTDGRIVGAALDRNGLRPSRYAITSSGLVVAGSEAGLVDLDPNEIIESGRLGPGQMLAVDLVEHRVYDDQALLELFDRGEEYSQLAEVSPLTPLPLESLPDAATLLATQRGFGYTREDVKMILQPMAIEGKDVVWSMGDDTPLAFLARAPRPVYAYFRQRFAQVTNPAIDPLREAVVVSLDTRLGPWPHLLDKHAALPGLSLKSPLLSLGQVAALRAGKYPHLAELRLAEIPCVFAPSSTPFRGAQHHRRPGGRVGAWRCANHSIVRSLRKPGGPAHTDGDGHWRRASGARRSRNKDPRRSRRRGRRRPRHPPCRSHHRLRRGGSLPVAGI